MSPHYLKDSDEKVDAALKGLNPAELWYGRCGVEVLHPAAKIHDHSNPIVDKDRFWSNVHYTVLKHVKEADDVSKTDEFGDL